MIFSEQFTASARAKNHYFSHFCPFLAIKGLFLRKEVKFSSTIVFRRIQNIKSYHIIAYSSSLKHFYSTSSQGSFILAILAYFWTKKPYFGTMKCENNFFSHQIFTTISNLLLLIEFASLEHFVSLKFANEMIFTMKNT